MPPKYTGMCNCVNRLGERGPGDICRRCAKKNIKNKRLNTQQPLECTQWVYEWLKLFHNVPCHRFPFKRK